VPIMARAAEQTLTTLHNAAITCSELNLKQLFGNYTMEVIAQSAFCTRPNTHFTHQASRLFTFPFWRKFLDYVVPMWILDSLAFTVLPKEPMDFFEGITQRLIQERRSTPVNELPKDYLQLLLQAEGQEDENSDSNSTSSNKLSEQEILAQCVLFFSVGFETSSQLLMYAAYCLALNPECQETLYVELLGAFGSDDSHDSHDSHDTHQQIDAEKLKSLPYLTAVIDETLRLYNPVLRMERRATEDFKLEGTDIVVTKDMIVGIPVWAMHHCADFFPEPEKFDPTRFLGENGRHIKTSSSYYLPFGQGPRDCIGRRFALLECQLLLAEMVLKFKFVPSPQTPQPIKFVVNGRPLLGPTDIKVGVVERS